MSPETMLITSEEPNQENGILFVRINDILKTMVKRYLIITGLIIMSVIIPLQISFSSSRSLELIIYSDGSTHVSTKIDVNSLQPDFELDLFGSSINNFVAIGDTGFMLSEKIVKNKAIIYTLGSSEITTDYDIQDLISKEGRVWTFTFNSPINYTLLLPKNSVIVGMNQLPNNMEQVDEQTKLDLNAGLTEINYIFTTTINSTQKPIISNDSLFNYVNLIIILGISSTAIVVLVIILKRKQQKLTSNTQTQFNIENITEKQSVNTEIIYDFKPEMREDDKEIIKFISNNKGQAFESELRKKFLLPRTTMWRAVKRLERLGLIEIIKKDLQNLVKLKKDMVEEK